MDVQHSKALKAATTVKEASNLYASDALNNKKACAVVTTNTANCKLWGKWTYADKVHLSALKNEATAAATANDNT